MPISLRVLSDSISTGGLGNPVANMRVALFVEQLPDAGGGFQQTLSTALRLAEGLKGHEVVILTPFQEVAALFAKLGIEACIYENGKFARFTDIISALYPQLGRLMQLLQGLGWKQLGRKLDNRLTALGIDFALFNLMSNTPQRLANHPFAVTVWDLAHRDWNEFPEVSSDREFERREQVLRSILPKAVAIIANAPSGAERIAHLYGVDRSRVKIIPFFPSHGVCEHLNGRRGITTEDLRIRYALPADFIFYPAQFWPHKNHIYILEATAILARDRGVHVDLVFAGGDQGARAHVECRARELGVIDQVHFLGFVADDEIPVLYEAARALVMPSYFGPTNLPPLEAAALGCPVIYSDLPGFREQMGEAALYCDLQRPESLADHIQTILSDPACVARLKRAGLALTAAMDPDIYPSTFQALLDDFAYKRRLWAPAPR